MEDIQRFIADYDTPEAAQSDLFFNAPNARGYLEKQYQALTGDAFADPFQKAKRFQSDAMTEAAMNGASVATGSNMGPRILSMPQQQQPQVAPMVNGKPQVVQPMTNMEGTPLSALGNRTTQNSLMTSLMQERGREYQMAGTDLMAPPPGANDYLQKLEQRASLSGSRDLFDKIQRSNPSVFSASPSSDDPRFSRVQGGKDGKIEAADSLHPIALDPHFMQETRRNPAKAKALYSAITNGRDYETDVKAKSGLLAEQRDARKKLIEGIKNPQADPVTGEVFKLVDTKGQDGKIVQQRVPIDSMERAAIEAEPGEFKRIYGMDLPNRKGLTPYGESPEEQLAHRELTQKIMAEKKLPADQASKLAQTQLYQQQQNRGVQPAATNTGGGPLDAMGFWNLNDIAAPIVNVNTGMLNALKSQLNVPSRVANAGLSIAGSDQRIPLIPDIPRMNTERTMSRQDVEDRTTAMAFLQRLMGRGLSGFSSN